MGEEHHAFVTLATDDNYALGALVLGNSLRSVQTTKDLIVLITDEVTDVARTKLSQVFTAVHEVNLMDSKDYDKLALMSRPELGKTFTKLHIWKLTNYNKCVFLDADTLVLQNCDELFQRNELSAVPDIGWPDCFNSGVFIFKPSTETFNELLQMAMEKGSFDGGDQGLLNTYFSNWATDDISKHLSFLYNMVTSTTYTYVPAYRQYGGNVKIIHFLGTVKPWMHIHRNKQGNFEPCATCQDSADHLYKWWDIYSKHVADPIPEEQVICQQLHEVSIASETSEPIEASPSVETIQSRQSAWEQGQIDYLGSDSFENIKQKLEDAINGSSKL